MHSVLLVNLFDMPLKEADCDCDHDSDKKYTFFSNQIFFFEKASVLEGANTMYISTSFDY